MKRRLPLVALGLLVGCSDQSPSARHAGYIKCIGYDGLDYYEMDPPDKFKWVAKIARLYVKDAADQTMVSSELKVTLYAIREQVDPSYLSYWSYARINNVRVTELGPQPWKFALRPDADGEYRVKFSMHAKDGGLEYLPNDFPDGRYYLDVVRFRAVIGCGGNVMAERRFRIMLERRPGLGGLSSWMYSDVTEDTGPWPGAKNWMQGTGWPLYYECYRHGDLDLDGDVDEDDVAAFIAGYSGPGFQSDCGSPADFNGDNDVDLTDFATLQAAYTGAGRVVVVEQRCYPVLCP